MKFKNSSQRKAVMAKINRIQSNQNNIKLDFKMWELSQKNDKGKSFNQKYIRLTPQKQKMVDFISKQRETGLWYKGKKIIRGGTKGKNP